MYTGSNRCINSKEFLEFIRIVTIDEDECTISLNVLTTNNKDFSSTM